jgi:arylsulfatase A-like enzyme
MLAGLAGGALVGLADGVRAALAARLGGMDLVAAALLVACVDGMGGALAGVVVELVARARAWGRRVTSPRWARAAGFVIVGLLLGAVAAGAVVATAFRVNRFLAGGVVAVAVAVVVAVVGPLVPAVARTLGARTTPREPTSSGATSRRDVGLWLALPLVVTVALTAIVFVVWRTRAPLRGAALYERSLWAAALAGVLPFLVALARRSSARVTGAWTRFAPVVALVSLGAPAIAVGALRWDKDLRFVPWLDLGGGALVLVAAAVVLLAGREVLRPWSGTRTLAVTLAMFMATALGVVALADGEAARKAASAHAALAGRALAAAAGALDFDRDGYPRLLGGGDCRDSDPAINPGALDWPGDGEDQDCDGQDASVEAPAAFPHATVPDGVPRELNIVFIAIDTLRADHLGCYGYRRPTSPVIDQLAAEGTLFINGWAHAPSTRYSMPAIVTARWPSAIEWENCHGCDSFWPRMGEGVRTVGEALHDLGYRTGAHWAYDYFNARWRRGFERGFDVYDTSRASLHTNVGGPAESVGSSARQISDDGIAFIDAHKDHKFFLMLHYYDPHLSYERHEGVPDFGPGSADLYDHEIRFTDDQIGRVFAHLRSQGLWERTAIVITGDHGEGFGEWGVSAHGYHLYPPQTKVPFIVRAPGLAPRRIAAPVGHVDLAPTLVNLARGNPEPGFLGRSLVSLMSDGEVTDDPRTVFQEVSYEGDNKKRALVSRTHQLIWNWTPHNTTECYDLAGPLSDPRDLWGTSAGEPECARLKGELRKMVARLSLPSGFQEKLATGVTPAGRAAPAPAWPKEGRIGDVLGYVGHDVSTGDVARGQPVEITHHFQVLRAVPAGWRLFFHLDGPAFMNLDHEPVGGAHPLARWQPGQRIRDQHAFTIDPGSPPGRYSLYVGLWRGGERMPVTPPALDDGQQRLRVLQWDVK